jgi:DNA-binding NtrC family response regulator
VSVLVSRYDPEYAVRAERALSQAGHRIDVVDSLREIGERVLAEDRVSLVVLTGGLDEPAVREFLDQLAGAAGRTAVIALADRMDVERIERWRMRGVDEVLPKPFDPDELKLVARRLLAREELVGRTRIVGRSEAVKVVLERVAQYAPVNSTVLIEGESGTGKELVARAIHDLSPRSGRPFLAVNCAALAESLLESELFGHEKGSFTGATSLRKGHFEIADRGTLFLDEVAEMPTATQVKLLRVLEEREFMRVGGSAPIKVDVRVIAATNKNLDEEVQAGRFRRDLYYRLAVLSIRMPPLRERREDVPLLIHHFVQEFCRENDREFVGITDEAMEVLQNYDWPGNVRELRNLVESMLVLTPGTRIRPRDIPADIFARANPQRLLPVTLADGEGEESGPSSRRIETLLSYFYRDLKSDLDAVRHEQARLRDLLRESSTPQWLEAVEVEADGGAEIEPAPRDGAPSRADTVSGQADTISAPADTVSARADTVSARADAVSAPRSAERVRFEVGMSLDNLEKEAIARTLASVGGNRRRAADMLGIGERTLYRKLKQYGL